ncbi:hypothetical protein D3C73_1056570 [compost metagenome]
MLDPARRGTQHPGIQAIGLADDRRQVAQVRQIDLIVGEGFVDHRARALEEIPLNLDALVGKGLFVDLLIAQHVHHAACTVLSAGAEVGYGDADFLEFGGLGGECQQARQGRNGDQADDAFEGNVHGCGSWATALRS